MEISWLALRASGTIAADSPARTPPLDETSGRRSDCAHELLPSGVTRPFKTFSGTPLVPVLSKISEPFSRAPFCPGLRARVILHAHTPRPPGLNLADFSRSHLRCQTEGIAPGEMVWAKSSFRSDTAGIFGTVGPTRKLNPQKVFPSEVSARSGFEPIALTRGLLHHSSLRTLSIKRTRGVVAPVGPKLAVISVLPS